MIRHWWINRLGGIEKFNIYFKAIKRRCITNANFTFQVLWSQSAGREVNIWFSSEQHQQDLLQGWLIAFCWESPPITGHCGSFSDLKMLSHWSHLKSFPPRTFSNTHTLVKCVGVWSRIEANRRPLCPILFSKCHHYHSKIPITSQCVQFYSPLSPIPTAWDPIISDNQVVWSLAALGREP